ncbi:MAG: macro domain-containing protein [Geminicoccaceae bacterium]
MIRFTEGNLLDAKAEALVNTVNTVGVMGKGIALMFKEAFPENTKAYEIACKEKLVKTGKMFVTERHQLMGPRWIINFPTKEHWRNPSRLEWIKAGLNDLRRVIQENDIHSIALPPLGSGNGGLNWPEVKSLVQEMLGKLADVDVIVYEPTKKYQNVAKTKGVEKLTPARALIAELVRRYSVVGIECTLLEVQKLAYFMEWIIEYEMMDNPLKLGFQQNKFGPYAHKLTHLLNGLDGSYLHCDKRLADADPLDTIRFDDSKRSRVDAYLLSEAKEYRPALDATVRYIEGFEAPLEMELLATIHWLVKREGVPARIDEARVALRRWPGERASERKLGLFDERLVGLALDRITKMESANA